MTRDPLHHWLVLLDVEDLGSRPDAVRSELRAAMHRMAGSALTYAGLDPGQCPTQDRGDSLLILIPGSVPPVRLLQTFVSSLDIDLRTHQQMHNASHRMRLLVGISYGLVAVDDLGFSGRAVEDLAELVDAGPVRDVLAQASRSQLVLVVPDDLFGSVVVQGRSPRIDPAAYAPRDFVTNRGRTVRGWVALPGHSRPPERILEESAQDTDERRATGSIGVSDNHGSSLVDRSPDGVHAPSGHTPPGPEHDPDDDWPRRTPER
ncbi:hypothetical protein [Streptomyces sp. NPDC017435]|uniref:hypothetical protein n=1 Tax=Streptomyces sp. NPDC017435 TaxID=3364995 RepID=UPI0037A30F34